MFNQQDSNKRPASVAADQSNEPHAIMVKIIKMNSWASAREPNQTKPIRTHPKMEKGVCFLMLGCAA